MYRKNTKKILIVLTFGFLLLASAVLIRTVLFTSKKINVQPTAEIRINDEQFSQHLAGALRFQTISYQDSNKFNGEEFLSLHAYLEKVFPKVHSSLEREIVNNYSLLYTWEGMVPELKPILFMAHQDVVPVISGTEKDWTYPPFDGEIAEGYIWGRGTLDVKSGVMGILEAVEALLQGGFQPKRTVYIAFGHDEEVGGQRGALQIAKLFQARNIKFEYVLDEGGFIIQGFIPGVSNPVALVNIAEKGYLSLELTVRGEGGHSSRPPKNTAVGILSKAITRLEENPFPSNLNYAAQLFESVGPEMPFLQKMIFANFWLFGPLIESILSETASMDAGMRTTTAATMFSGSIKDNILPINATAVVNFRIIPGDSISGVVSRVKNTIDDLRVQVRIMDYSSEPSPVSDINSKSFEILQQTIYQVAGEKELIVVPYLLLGATDSRYFTGLSNNIYRFLINKYGPDDLKRIHGTNERISVEDYFRIVKFYYQLLLNSNQI